MTFYLNTSCMFIFPLNFDIHVIVAFFHELISVTNNISVEFGINKCNSYYKALKN